MRYVLVKHQSGTEMAVNMSHIVYVRPYGSGAEIGMNNGDKSYVKDTYDEIMAAIHKLDVNACVTRGEI